MGKRKGRQRDTRFTVFTTIEFRVKFYERRHEFDAQFKRLIEREAKARGIRNVRKR